MLLAVVASRSLGRNTLISGGFVVLQNVTMLVLERGCWHLYCWCGGVVGGFYGAHGTKAYLWHLFYCQGNIFQSDLYFRFVSSYSSREWPWVWYKPVSFIIYCDLPGFLKKIFSFPVGRSDDSPFFFFYFLCYLDHNDIFVEVGFVSYTSSQVRSLIS